MEQRNRSTNRLVRILAIGAVALCLVPGSQHRTAEASADNAVVNGSAETSLDGWEAAAQGGPVEARRMTGITGPFSGTTAIEFSGTRPGAWTRALSRLRNPQSFFQTGRTYRMQLWVRDPEATGNPVRILLANGNFVHRPTEVSEAGRFTDNRWHLITRTFVSVGPAFPDTAFYVELPTASTFRIQLTRASVRPVSAATPKRFIGAPTRTITFPGAAGAAVDVATWSHETGGQWGNNEQQTYTNRTANAHVDGYGRLQIVARRESYTGEDGVPRAFTSARLSTQDKLAVAPGSYLEATISAPTGTGLWPAFWTVGTNLGAIGWPASGELDILEVIGAQPTVALAAAHLASLADPGRDLEYGWGEAGARLDLQAPVDVVPHTYGVYFDAHTVRFYVDRKERMSLWADDASASGRRWAFGAAQFILLNVAISGGVDTSATTFPKTMEVGPISIWATGLPF